MNFDTVQIRCELEAQTHLQRRKASVLERRDQLQHRDLFLVLGQERLV